MIGDAFAKGKVKSTTAAGPEFKKKNGIGKKGKSYKTIDGPISGDGGGDEENAATSKRSTRGMRNGTGVEEPNEMYDAVQNMRNGMGAGKSFKAIYPKDNGSDAGAKVDEWVRGKRKSYR